MIVVVDNYDSFTFNVVQSLERLSGDTVAVVRSKETSVADIESLKPDYLVISPGPGTPSEAGISIAAIRHFAGKVPILGICLGHQAIAQAFGATIVQATYIRHGIVEEMDFDGRGLFRIIGKSGSFTRYHSLVIDESTLSGEFEVTARAKDGDIMGIRHKTLPIEGVQFHPESIASQAGDDLFRAFLHYRRENLPVAQYLTQLIDEKKPLTRAQSALMAVRIAAVTFSSSVPSVRFSMKSADFPPPKKWRAARKSCSKRKRRSRWKTTRLRKSSERAATARAASTSARFRQSSRQAAASPWQSTATAPSRQNQARRIFLRASVSKSWLRPKKRRSWSDRPASAS